MKSIKPTIVAIFILFFVAVSVTSILKKSSTTDEFDHIAFGREVITRTLKGASMQKMPVTSMNALPVYLIEKIGLKIHKNKKLFIARLPTIAAAAILATFVFAWSFRLYGFSGGLFSLFLFVFSPNIMAHARLATNDIYCALFIFLSVNYFLRYLKSRNRKEFIIFCLLTGFSEVVKQTALLLFPFYIIFYLIYEFVIRKKDIKSELFQYSMLKNKIFKLAVFVLVIVSVINFSYGFQGSFLTGDDYLRNFSQKNNAITSNPILVKAASIGSALSFMPIPFPRAFIEAFLVGIYYNATGKGHGPIYLLGKLSRLGWWYYFPVAAFFKFPVSLFLFMILSLISIKYRSIQFPDEIAVFIFTGMLLIFFCFFCSAQIGIRYLLPMLPFAYLFMGRMPGLVMKSQKWSKMGFLLLMVWYAGSSISYYPHYISYFNELIGNRMNAYRYLADSNLDWGQNRRYLNGYIKVHKGEKISVNPTKKTTGTVIVSANNLVGITHGSERFQWLRDHYKPVDQIAYSYLVYKIPETEGDAAP